MLNLRKHEMVMVGIILISTGAIMLPIGLDFENARRVCEFPKGLQFPPGNERFLPNTVVTSTCPVLRDIGQDLTLWAQFIAQGSGKSIAIPVHIEIRDPNNQILVDKDFKTIIL